MSHRLLASIGVLWAAIAAVWLASVTAAGQATTAVAKPPATTAARAWTHPRTPWGDPDLQGIWNNTAENAVPLERSRDFGEKQVLDDKEFAARQAKAEQAARARARSGAGIGGPEHWGEGARAGGQQSRRTSLIVDPADGRLPPLTPEAQTRAKAREAARRGIGPVAAWAKLHVWDRCITRGLPDAMLPRLYGNNYLILQAPGYVVILYEMIHDARVIPLDGRPHLPQTVREWMGDSRGRWEGSTLVVETTNFTAKTEGELIPHVGGGSYRGAGETLRLVERFTRVAADTIDYRFTIDDPKLYARPWTAAIPLTTNNSPDQIFEYACHEGNYAVPHTLSGALAEEKAAEEAAKKK